ncbi:hypothetical protein IFO70_30045 [Phormidium tenue FACHB-886]|nr:hypothetical protein [Phormidium tenue FACHB-886]
MASFDSARTSGQISSTSAQAQPELEKDKLPVSQSGFALKLASQKHLIEFSAQGTAVALTALLLLALGIGCAWQHTQASSKSSQTAEEIHK